MYKNILTIAMSEINISSFKETMQKLINNYYLFISIHNKTAINLNRPSVTIWLR